MRQSNRNVLIYTCFVLVIVISVYFLVHFSLRKNSSTPFKEGDFSSYFPNSEIRVVLYGTSWCQACVIARNYFRNKHIDFVDYDIENSDAAKKQYLKLGGKAVPLLLIGNRRIEGFNAKVTSAALAQLPQNAKSKVFKE